MATNKRRRVDGTPGQDGRSEGAASSVRSTSRHQQTPGSRSAPGSSRRRKSGTVSYVEEDDSSSEAYGEHTSGRASSTRGSVRKLKHRSRRTSDDGEYHDDEGTDSSQEDSENESSEFDESVTHSVSKEPGSPHSLKVGMHIVAQDYKGNWCNGSVVAVEKAGKLRIKINGAAAASGRRKTSSDSKRGSVFTPSKKVKKVVGTFGDWIRIHFRGFNANQDEWIRYDRGGHICTQTDKTSSEECPCSRHFGSSANGTRTPRNRLSSIAKSANSSMKKYRYVHYTSAMHERENKLVARIQELIDKLDISFSQVCREASIDSNSNAARNWMKRLNLHQPSTHLAAKQIVNWFNSRRQEIESSGSDAILLSPDEYESEDDEPEKQQDSQRGWSKKSKGSSTTKSKRSQSVSESQVPKLLNSGVSFSNDQWEANVTAFRNTVPIYLGGFETADEAKSAAETARRAIAIWKRQHTPDIQLEGNRVPTQHECSMCAETGDIASMIDCASCQKYFHQECVTNATTQTKEQDDSVLNASSHLCEDCKAELVKVALDATTFMNGRVGPLPPGGTPGLADVSQKETSSTRSKKISLHTSIPRSPLGRMSQGSRSRHRSSPGGPWRSSNSFDNRSHNRSARSEPDSDSPKIVKPDTEWIGDGFRLDNRHWNHRVYYSGFKFVTSDVEYKVLDHVILDRIHDEVCVPSEAGGSGELLEYYIGQLESLWEEPDGTKKARVAWMFWPEESDLGRTSENHQHEVYTSSEVDINPLSAVAGKLKVVPECQYEEVKQKLEEAKTDKRLRTRMTPEAKQQYFEKVTKRQHNPFGSRVLFVRHHYHHRASKLVGTDYETGSKGSGLNPWVAPFLFSTFDQPDVSKFVEEDAVEAQKPISQYIANTSAAVADVPDLGEEPAEDQLMSKEYKLQACGFCRTPLWMGPAIECSVCPSLVMCVECFSLGRQGLVTCPPHNSDANGPEASVLASRTDIEDATKEGTHHANFMHRSHHAYRVSKPLLPVTKPVGAQKVLAELCSLKGIDPPEYHLVDVSRGPLPASETKAPPLRLRYGLKIDVPASGKKGKSKQFVGQILSTLYGNTVQEAKDFVALEGLKSLFGVATTLNFPLMSPDWSAWEAFRMLDAIRLKGLAWEFVAEIVGTKTPLECRVFFSQKLLPSWSATTEWKVVQQDRDAYSSSRLAPPSLEMTQTALSHALEWGEKIQAMRMRRGLKYQWYEGTKYDKTKERGLLFAMIDGSILQLPNPKTEALRIQRENEIATNSSNRTCVVCNNSGSERRGTGIVECEACGDAYHMHCLNTPLSSLPDSDWLCPNCKEDYEYVQNHSALGSTGKALCELIQVYGKGSTPSTAGDVRVTRHGSSSNTEASMDAETLQKQWELNDELVQSVVDKAALLSGPLKSSSKKVKLQSSSSDANAVPTMTPSRSSARISNAQQQPSVSTNPLDAQQQIGTTVAPLTHDDLAWTTRHYAAETVGMLELTNRGLGEALAVVTAQRDALVQVLSKKGFKPEQLEFLLNAESNFIVGAQKLDEFEVAEK